MCLRIPALVLGEYTERRAIQCWTETDARYALALLKVQEQNIAKQNTAFPAQSRKKQQTFESRPPDHRREYMRGYMRAYRQRQAHIAITKTQRVGEQMTPQLTSYPVITTLLLLLPIIGIKLTELDLNIETIKVIIEYAEMLAIKLTGLIILFSTSAGLTYRTCCGAKNSPQPFPQ